MDIESENLEKDVTINHPEVHISAPQSMITNITILTQVIRNLILTLCQNSSDAQVNVQIAGEQEQIIFDLKVNGHNIRPQDII